MSSRMPSASVSIPARVRLFCVAFGAGGTTMPFMRPSSGGGGGGGGVGAGAGAVGGAG
jgi:hypothetical protein